LVDKFGFTAQETHEMLRYYQIDDIQAIQRWYNGYIFGQTNGMYNPWSILQCVDNGGKLKIYWANTSDNVLLERLIVRSSASTKSDLEHILKGGAIEKIIEESIVYPDIDKRNDLLWSVLLFTGYLTSKGDYQIKDGKTVCSLIIPNQEILSLYKDLISRIFKDSVIDGKAQELLQALIDGDTEVFSQILQRFILHSMSVYDLSSSEPEKSYHLFVLGLLVMLSDTYDVISNRESGLGRYDILIVPKDTSKPAVVIEFKKVWQDGPDALKIAAQKALDQIIDKKYAQELYNKGIEDIRAYGIALDGKSISIASCMLENPEQAC
jgi:hypothetical protein